MFKLNLLFEGNSQLSCTFNTEERAHEVAKAIMDAEAPSYDEFYEFTDDAGIWAKVDQTSCRAAVVINLEAAVDATIAERKFQDRVSRKYQSNLAVPTGMTIPRAN